MNKQTKRLIITCLIILAISNIIVFFVARQSEKPSVRLEDVRRRASITHAGGLRNPAEWTPEMFSTRIDYRDMECAGLIESHPDYPPNCEDVK